MNRHFQAKQAKYLKFHVIETTASILTKFGVTRDHQVVIVGGTSRRSTNPRWRMAANLKKSVKSPFMCDRLTDLDEI